MCRVSLPRTAFTAGTFLSLALNMLFPQAGARGRSGTLFGRVKFLLALRPMSLCMCCFQAPPSSLSGLAAEDLGSAVKWRSQHNELSTATQQAATLAHSQVGHVPCSSFHGWLPGFPSPLQRRGIRPAGRKASPINSAVSPSSRVGNL